MTRINIQRALAVAAEPTRFRILDLLSEKACTVSEVAAAIDALQPQTTKHLQALESAGLIVVHRLGRRRVARLDRGAMRMLAEHFEAFGRADPDDVELDAYEQAIRDRTDDAGAKHRIRLERRLPASVSDIWVACTDPALVARWWAPRHFTVDALEIGPEPGSAVRLALREGDGARYVSAGRIETVEPPHLLEFSLAPLDDAGRDLFRARYSLTLWEGGGDRGGAEEAAGTDLQLTIDVEDASPAAGPAVAGLEPGWRQLLDALEDLLRDIEV
ncbi:SRPBCC domain-containing protein [Microbacterium sp. CJ88]|uniref:SRPBCC domain-containing protein n=1 Tax=Microbacterium sp. CJ88 TaxID=3445672 RepID=UPI003F65FC15